MPNLILYTSRSGDVHSLNVLSDGDDYWAALVGDNNFIFGDRGDDKLYGNSGRDFLAGGEGRDTISGGYGNDELYGDGDRDTLIGGEGKDTLVGGGGDDFLISGTDPFTGAPKLALDHLSDAPLDAGGVMDGGTGNDILAPSMFLSASQSIYGGDGIDGVDYTYQTSTFAGLPPAGVPVNVLDLESGQGTTPNGGSIYVQEVENITGSDFRDDFRGDDNVNILKAGLHSDVLEGRGGADILDGGGDFDAASYVSASSGVSIDLKLATQRATNEQGLSNGDAAGDQLISIEEVRGSQYNDVLRGSVSSATGGKQALFGNGGSDVIEGRQGVDAIDGGDGFDYASYESSAGRVIVTLAAAGMTSTGQLNDAAGDRLIRIEGLIGSAFGDTFTGNGDLNRFKGGGGADTLSGMGGNDVIDGGAGNDIISGGTGRDELTGGADQDTFVFALGDSNGAFMLRDMIVDFQRDFHLNTLNIEGDTINVHDIDAQVQNGAVGNQNFQFIGSAAFTAAGQLRVTQQTDSLGRVYSLVEADVSGDHISDLSINVYTTTHAALTAADFFL